LFFLVLGVEGGLIFLVYSKCVPKMLSSNSQNVLLVFNVFPKMLSLGFQNVPLILNVFPKMFPISPHFLSHIVCPWFNFHVYNL
jgi:hypothetical protein